MTEEQKCENQAEAAVASNGSSSSASNGKTEDTTELDNSIIRQIEYYFGDFNLPKDKFLKEQVELDDGWVPLTTMLKFKRLASLTEDLDKITGALAKSTKNLIEISEDKLKIRRSPEHPLPELNEERRKELSSRTAYLKGFPLENTTIDSCLQFFREHGYEPENVILRKYENKCTKTWHFKGSVFVTFPTKEATEKLLKDDTLKIGDNAPIKKWKDDYIVEKQAEIALRQSKIKEKKENKQKKDEKPTLVLPTGAVLTLSEVPNEITRESIKEAVVALGGEVAYVKIEDGKVWIRLSKENSAKPVFEKCTDGKLAVEGTDLPCALLEGDEEKTFLNEMAEDLIKFRGKMNKNNRNKGGRNFSRKRKGGGGDDGPHRKRK